MWQVTDVDNMVVASFKDLGHAEDWASVYKGRVSADRNKLATFRHVATNNPVMFVIATGFIIHGLAGLLRMLAEVIWLR